MRIFLTTLFISFLFIIFCVFSQSPKSQELLPPKEIFLRGEVSMPAAFHIADQINVYNSLGAGDITIYITSPGGDVYAGLVIYDAMMQSRAKIKTVCQGYCMSMAAVILASGDVREAEPSSTIMFHQLSTGVQGKVDDMEAVIQEARRLQSVIDRHLHDHSGLSLDSVRKMESYDHFMSPEEAKSLNLVDVVVSKVK